MATKCPKCGRDFVTRIQRKGTVDIVLGFLHIYPFRCGICSQRFRAFRLVGRYSRQRIDQRHYTPVETSFPVSFSWEQTRQEGRVTNIAVDGCRVETDARLAEGALVEDLRLQVPRFLPEIRVEAAVVRSSRATSVDFQFLRFTEINRAALGRYMLKVPPARR